MSNSRQRRYTFLLCWILATSGCTASESTDFGAAATDVEFSVISEGNLSNYGSDLHDVKRTEIYRSQQQLDSAMGRYFNGQSGLSIDFNTKQVVLLTLGIQANVGSTFRIDGSVENNGFVRLDVIYEASGTGCIQLGAVNHPYKILEVSSRNTIIINEKLELQDCVLQ